MSENYKNRVKKFQDLMKQKGIKVTMIRDSYAFRYFTGISWDPPALAIPKDGEPVIFAIEDEIEEIKQNTWINDIRPYRDVKTLITTVHEYVDDDVIGFNLDIDSSALLYDMFVKIHAKKKIVNIHPLLMSLRMFKDEEEIKNIKKAGQIAEEGMKSAISAIVDGASELDIQAEAYYKMKKLGAEEIFIYVNTGSPRVHAKPRNKELKDYVLIDLMPSYNGYYFDMARTIIIDSNNKKRKNALMAMEEVHNRLNEIITLGNVFNQAESKVKNIFDEYGLQDEYIYGFSHGVGLRFEEAPIMTIVPGDRMKPVKPNMVIAVGHAPLSSPSIGTIKIEDTYLIEKDGNIKRLSSLPLLIEI